MNLSGREDSGGTVLGQSSLHQPFKGKDGNSVSNRWCEYVYNDSALFINVVKDRGHCEG